MARDRQLRNAKRLGIVSGVVVVLCLFLLIGEYVLTLTAEPGNKRVVDEYVTQVKTDAEAAQLLHDERDRQTAVSLARQSRGKIAAWVLLVTGGLFVISGKWYMSMRPQPLPSLDQLVADRFAPSPSRSGKTTPSRSSEKTTEEDGVDLAFVDGLFEEFGTGREAAIPILQAIQTHYRYLPDEALARVCERTEITAAQIAGTSSFYAQFRRSPVGRHVVRVCHGTACHVAGAEQITQELRRHLDIAPEADTDPRRMFTVDAVACLGCCSLAPVMMIEEDTVGRLTPASARQALDAVEPPE
jgi:NADH:ubiquinone oxidoreductase subunit E